MCLTLTSVQLNITCQQKGCRGLNHPEDNDELLKDDVGRKHAAGDGWCLGSINPKSKNVAGDVERSNIAEG